jgi:hypothetical protein
LIRDMWFHTQFHPVIVQTGAEICAIAETGKRNKVVRAVRIDIWESRRVVGRGTWGKWVTPVSEARCDYKTSTGVIFAVWICSTSQSEVRSSAWIHRFPGSVVAMN